MGMKVIDSLDRLMGGAAAERFNDALQDVLRNVFDPNTSAKARRQITLTVTVKPDKNRKTAIFEIDVKRKTAPHETLSSTCFIEKNGKGQVVAYEDNGQLEGQMDMTDATTEQETMQAGDMETPNVATLRFPAAK